jgi:signal transduction histidine kinase
MMLGAILESATPLRRNVEAALHSNFPSAAKIIPKIWRWNFAPRQAAMALVVSAWIAAFLLLLICFVALAAALQILDAADEMRVLQFIDNRRVPLAALVFGAQIILVLATIAYCNRSRRLKGLLSETQHQIAYAMGAAEVGLWRWNAESGPVWLSDQAREIVKLEPGRLYDAPTILALINPEDLPRLQEAVIAGSKSGAPFDVDVRLATENEHSHWMRCRGRAQTDGEGHIAQVSGTVVDITDRIAMQAEIKHQRESLIHLSRVGTIGKLSGALAHELSQPLTAIMNNAHAIDRMLRQEPINISEVRAAISDIIEDDSRVHDVIGHMRALLKKDQTGFGPVDMTLLTHKVLGLLRKELTLHRIKPTVAISPNASFVWGDAVQLQQLLLNLIINAIDAIEATGKNQGSLSITAYSREEPELAYYLQISDSGCGMKAEVIEKLFEPFFSTKTQGLGLGLAISHAIVSGHNGTIRAENNVDGGTSFHITLPVESA